MCMLYAVYHILVAYISSFDIGDFGCSQIQFSFFSERQKLNMQLNVVIAIMSLKVIALNLYLKRRTMLFCLCH